MNKKLKAKLLRALRGGQYRQGTQRLVDDDGTKFCCLGVLADIQGCEWLPDMDNGGMVPISLNGRKPWVPEATDYLPPSRAGGLSRDNQAALASMNDRGHSFKEIANHIDSAL